jgi:hypothetical protein
VWAARAGLLIMVVIAAWFAPRAPLVTVILLLVVTLALGAAWWVGRGNERLVAAAERGDFATMERLAERRVTRYASLVTLAVHAGVAHARSLGERAMCTCGQCELDADDEELLLVMRALALVEEGHADRALRMFKDHPISPDVLPPAVPLRMAITVYTRLLTGHMLEPALVTEAARAAPTLRPAVNLAMVWCLAENGMVSDASAWLSTAGKADSRRMTDWRAQLAEWIANAQRSPRPPSMAAGQR